MMVRPDAYEHVPLAEEHSTVSRAYGWRMRAVIAEAALDAIYECALEMVDSPERGYILARVSQDRAFRKGATFH
jgi:hypothetical protein